MTEDQLTYVRYSDDIEVKQPNEDEQTREVVDSMARVNRLMFDKHRHAVREWPQEMSPYREVGKITIASQEVFSPERRVYADDVLSFNPFHCIPEHRPLGGIMRIRRLAYDTSSKYRHHMNVQPRVEPQSIDELPD